MRHAVGDARPTLLPLVAFKHLYYTNDNGRRIKRPCRMPSKWQPKAAAQETSTEKKVRLRERLSRRRRSMAEQYVGKTAEFKDGDRRIIFAGENEIGIFRHEGAFYAYSNFCLHQGGPACEGLTIAKVEERLMPDKTSRGLYFSDTALHFVCPWHGM